MNQHLDRVARRRRLAQLVDAEPGLNQRELAERLGVSQATVQRDLQRLTRDSPTDSPDTLPETHVTHPAHTTSTPPGESPARITWADRLQRESDALAALTALLDAMPADSPHRHALTVPTAPQLIHDLGTLMDGTDAPPQTVFAAAVYAVAAAWRDEIDAGTLTPGPVKITRVHFVPVTPEQLADDRSRSHPSRRLLSDPGATMPAHAPA